VARDAGVVEGANPSFNVAYFERTQRGDPQRKKIAVVATVHYLVRVMWALLKWGTVWQENEARAQ
jgi:hypothetical protein